MTRLFIACVLLLSLPSVAAETQLVDNQRAYTSGFSMQRTANSLNPMYLDGAVDSNYRIGPGDFFDLYVEGTYFSLQVSPEGSLGIERVGVVQVGGMTLAESKRALLHELTKRFTPSECFVQLSQLKRFRVPLSGAVNTPGQFPVDGGTRLSVLLRQAGGLQPLADKGNIWVLRGKDTLIVDLLADQIGSEDNSDPILIQGDRIQVSYLNTTGNLVSIKENNSTWTSGWKQGLSVAEYLRRSGYLAAGKVPEHLRLVDANGKVLREGSYDSLGSARLESPYSVEIGDKTGKQTVYVAGMVGRLGAVDYDESYTPMDYVAAAGVTPYSAPLGQIVVVRYATAERESIDPVKGIVNPGDVLELPRSRYERTKDLVVFLATLISLFSSTLIIYQSFKQ